MQIKTLAVLALVAVCCVAWSPLYQGHHVASVACASREACDQLSARLDEQGTNVNIWKRMHQRIDFTASARSYAVIRAAIATHPELTLTEEGALDALLDAHYEEVMAALESDNYFDAYHPYADIVQFMDQLCSDYTALCEKTTMGTSWEGRDINVYSLTDSSVPSNDKIDVVLNGNVHAREWISSATMQFIANSLLSNFTTGVPEVQQVFANFTVHIVPVLNPDGYNYTWTTDRLWRKNRHPYNQECTGIDNNRNWAWDHGGPGTSNIPCSGEYPGPFGFSEPEETSLADFTTTLKNMQAFYDFHSYSQLYMNPWGNIPNATVDVGVQQGQAAGAVAAIKSVHGKVFQYGQIYEIVYPSSGDSADWTYGVADAVYSYGIELRPTTSIPGFLLPPKQIIPSGQEQVAGMMYSFQYFYDNQRAPQKGGAPPPASA